jgi:hypothetical protein
MRALPEGGPVTGYSRALPYVKDAAKNLFSFPFYTQDLVEEPTLLCLGTLLVDLGNALVLACNPT